MAIYHTIGRSGSLGERVGILYEVLMSGQNAFKAVLISSGLRDAHVSLESRGADRGLHPTPPLFLCFGLLIICSVTSPQERSLMYTHLLWFNKRGRRRSAMPSSSNKLVIHQLVVG